jgi:hypothetical protein
MVGQGKLAVGKTMGGILRTRIAPSVRVWMKEVERRQAEQVEEVVERLGMRPRFRPLNSSRPELPQRRH